MNNDLSAAEFLCRLIYARDGGKVVTPDDALKEVFRDFRTPERPCEAVKKLITKAMKRVFGPGDRPQRGPGRLVRSGSDRSTSSTMPGS